MRETTRQYDMVLLDESVVCNAPLERLRQMLDELLCQRTQVYIPGTFNARIACDEEEDKNETLKSFRENYSLLREYQSRNLNVQVWEPVRGADGDILSTAAALSRICMNRKQRMQLVTADYTLLMKIILKNIKCDIRFFSADEASKTSEADIFAEDFDAFAREMYYPWVKGEAHNLYQQQPAADVTQKVLYLTGKDDGKRVELHQDSESGAEAVLYTVAGDERKIAKIFRPYVLNGKPLDWSKLLNVQQLVHIQKGNRLRYAVLPEQELLDENGHVVGYLMRRIGHFENWLNMDFSDTRKYDEQVLDAVDFCAKIVWMILRLFSLGILIYDFGYKNLGIDWDTKEPVVLDLDSALKDNYLPLGCGKDFKAPKLERGSTTRSEAISACIKSTYLFVAHVLLGAQAPDKEEAWVKYGFRVPMPLRSFLKDAVNKEPEDVPYLDALLEKLYVVLNSSAYQNCTYEQLLNAPDDPYQKRREAREQRAQNNDYWEPVLHNRKADPDEPVFLSPDPEKVFVLPINDRHRKASPVRPAQKDEYCFRKRQDEEQEPPVRKGRTKLRLKEKKYRFSLSRFILLLILLAILFVVDMEQIRRIPELIGKLREIVILHLELLLEYLREMPKGSGSGLRECARSIFLH